MKYTNPLNFKDVTVNCISSLNFTPSNITTLRHLSTSVSSHNKFDIAFCVYPIWTFKYYTIFTSEVPMEIMMSHVVDMSVYLWIRFSAADILVWSHFSTSFLQYLDFLIKGSRIIFCFLFSYLYSSYISYIKHSFLASYFYK